MATVNHRPPPTAAVRAGRRGRAAAVSSTARAVPRRRGQVLLDRRPVGRVVHVPQRRRRLPSAATRARRVVRRPGTRGASTHGGRRRFAVDRVERSPTLRCRSGRGGSRSSPRRFARHLTRERRAAQRRRRSVPPHRWSARPRCREERLHDVEHRLRTTQMCLSGDQPASSTSSAAHPAVGRNRVEPQPAVRVGVGEANRPLRGEAPGVTRTWPMRASTAAATAAWPVSSSLDIVTDSRTRDPIEVEQLAVEVGAHLCKVRPRRCRRTAAGRRRAAGAAAVGPGFGRARDLDQAAHRPRDVALGSANRSPTSLVRKISRRSTGACDSSRHEYGARSPFATGCPWSGAAAQPFGHDLPRSPSAAWSRTGHRAPAGGDGRRCRDVAQVFDRRSRRACASAAGELRSDPVRGSRRSGEQVVDVVVLGVDVAAASAS